MPVTEELDSVITLEEANRVITESPFGPFWGFTVSTVGSGTATVLLPARPELFRPGGVLQGGCCMTLADVAFWIAIMTRSGTTDRSVTLEMKTNFLAPATSDLACTARVVTYGRSVAFGVAETTELGGRMVAHHSVTYLRPHARS